MSELEITTRDGRCPSYVWRPPGRGPWPAVLVYMDGIGIRPALFEMGERMAGHGYFVLLPDLFYRAGPYEPLDPKRLFTDLEFRQAWFAKYASTASQANVRSDTEAFLAFLGAQKDVVQPKVGTTGYCLGGALALRTAAHRPDDVAAAAAFHPARLATDAPDSPHLLADRVRAEVYVEAADQDQGLPPEQQQRLDDALTEAGVTHVCEQYDGAAHGFTMSDTAVYDEAGTERHWTALLDLLGRTLR